MSTDNSNSWVNNVKCAEITGAEQTLEQFSLVTNNRYMRLLTINRAPIFLKQNKRLMITTYCYYRKLGMWAVYISLLWFVFMHWFSSYMLELT